MTGGPAAPDPRRRAAALGGWAAAAVLVVVLVMVGVFAIGGGTGGRGGSSPSPRITGSGAPTTAPTTSRTTTGGATVPPVPAAVVPDVPASVLAAVGLPASVSVPPRLRDQPPLAVGGLPAFVYVGAEYCPFCAAERWAIVVALSRFGTFTRLGTTHSSTSDEYPDTATFSFHDSTYVSSFVSFVPAELYSNVPAPGGGYELLDHATRLAADAFDRYAFPPYTNQEGGFPFVDVDNRMSFIGSNYSPGILGGLSFAAIRSRLGHPSDPVARAVDGTANYLIAAVCAADGGRPAAVCTAAVTRRAARVMGLSAG